MEKGVLNIKHKVFISYHHSNDQFYKNELLALNYLYDIFIDGSVDTDDIDETLADQKIRTVIRDDYLGNSTVTVLLVGSETKNRKHIDWELYSSMFDGSVNKKSGVLVVQLPGYGDLVHAAHGDQEKTIIYPGCSWTSVNSRAEYKQRHPYLPDRIIDNLVSGSSMISVTTWDTIVNSPDALKILIELAFSSRTVANYDLSRNMLRRNL